MKKNQILLGAAGLLALGLTACSNDDLKVVDQKVEKDTTSYLSVAICNPTNFMTREGEFENGTIAESEVNQLVFVFYDGSGAPTATMYSLDATDNELNTGWTTNNSGSNVARVWESVIPVEMVQGQSKPVYVMCFVNPIDQTNLATSTLSEIDADTRKIVENNGKFAMSNSVYYGSNPITGQNNVRVMATPITDGMLYTTEADAKANPALEIFVERYAAKIGVTMTAAAATEGYSVYNAATGEESTIVFTPEYWHPNAMDKETYITKGFATGPGGSVENPASFQDMTTAFASSGMVGNGIKGWNDPENHRSYWTCTPSYFAGIYPQCSDNITDEGAPDYEVKYFTYKEVANGIDEEDGDIFTKPGISWNATNGFSTNDATSDGWFYARETTASSRDITAENKNNKAVVASVVIVGKYKLAGQAGNASTFYLYGKQDGKDVYYASEATVKTALIANQNVIFTDNALTTRATSADLFTVAHPSKKVRTQTITTGSGEEEPTETKVQNVAGRLVTIQINPELENAPDLWFYDGDKAVQVTSGNIDAANRLLWSSASTAQMFGDGLAFFSVPIRHLGWGKGTIPADKPLVTKNETTGMETINWQNLRPGDLGVVRNHVYQLEITGIKGLGIGLRNADQPMVPPMDPDNYYISAKLNILPWRIVPKQEGIIL